MEFRLENGWNGGGWLLDSRMQGLFMNSDAATAPIVPPVDVIEDKDAYHFYFEMPGLKNDSIDARIENGRLIVAAERKRPEWPQETEVLVAERRHGTIRRAFELPQDASHDKVDATYKDGVLDLTVEKKAESKPAKIHIN